MIVPPQLGIVADRRREAGEPPSPPAFAADSILHVDGAALAGHPQAVAVADSAGRLISANQGFSIQQGLVSDDGLRLAEPVVEGLARLAEGTRAVRRVAVEGGVGRRVFDVACLPLAEGRRLVIATDRTVEVSLRNALVESRARFKDLVAVSSDFAWETNHDGTFSTITPKGLAGLPARDLIGTKAADLLDDGKPAPAVLPFTTPTPVENVEVWMRHADGHTICYLVSAVPLHDGEGALRGARGVCHDVTVERQQVAFLAEHRNRERVLARITNVFRREANPDDMLQVAASTCTHGLGASGCQIFTTRTPLAKSITRPQLGVTASFGVVAESARAEAVLARLADEKGDDVHVYTTRPWSVLAAPAVYAGRHVGALLLWRGADRPAWGKADETLMASIVGQVAVAIEQRIDYHLLLDASRTDPLTNLLNRRAFYEEVRRRFQRLERDEKTSALVYVDMDHFKQVNDVHGHEKGDEALKHLSDILRTNTRSTDLVARLGGDEFAVWLDGADEEVAAKRAQVFLAAASPLMRYSGSADKPLRLSIGVAVYYPKAREGLNEFVTRADVAMYKVKRSGRGSYSMAPPPETL
ncbi:MAG: diguanylate cyclase [Alphaproteobacteria bacterium]|nr:diguanylate cyclase [Alphaproteobacteria bacterium]